MDKYLNTKQGSLEESVLEIWKEAAIEEDFRMDGRTKAYKEHRAKLEAARIRREGIKKSIQTEESPKSGGKEEYKKFFNAAMKKFGVSSPAELKGDKEKEFYNYIDKNWKGDHEEGLEENAAVELQKKVAKGGMDKQMFQKSVDLLKSKKYDELKKHLKASDTEPREYVMSLIAKKEPATFKKMYGNQTGYMSLMKPKGLKEEDDHEVSMAVGQVRVMKERLDTIMSFLSSKTDDYNIEGWVQSYITSAEETLTTIADYLDKNPEVQSESRASTGASHNINQDDVKDSDTEKEKELKIKLDKEKDTDALERQIINLTGQLSVMKQKLENEKNRVVKPEPNPDTGEVPLRTGLANAIMSKKGKSDDLVKKVEKPKEMKISGQSKIQVNPKADLGQYAGGNKVNTGNLH